MRLSSVGSTPDKLRRDLELKDKTQILWMDPTEKVEQIKMAEKLDTDSQLKLAATQQQTFDSMGDLPANLTEVMGAQDESVRFFDQVFTHPKLYAAQPGIQGSNKRMEPLKVVVGKFEADQSS